MNKKNINIYFVLVVSIVCVILFLLPTGFENKDMLKDTLREKAEILKVDNSDIKHLGLITVGSQALKIKVLSGKFKNEQYDATNILMGQMAFDKLFIEGNTVLVVLKYNKAKTKITSARATDIYRINYELMLFILFALFLVSFAGWTGMKALLSFLFTALSIWKILIPCFLKGVSPILISFIIVALCTAVIILLISGFSRKGFVALTGAITGVALTSILASVFTFLFQIDGSVQDFSELLLYSGFSHLNLTDIFISGIFIAAAGAVMDVAVDISAAQFEIIEKVPNISRKQLMKSGFSIAYQVIGTMTTTLLFAYSGSFMFAFMVFMAKGTPMINIFNTNYISAEILHTLVGSFGLVLVAPITAIVGSYVYCHKGSNSVVVE